MAATHHRHGSRTLPQRPCAHADPTTPAGEGELSGRLLPRPPTAFPLRQEGRLQQRTFEACSGFIFLSACALAPWLHQGLPRRLQWTISRLNCSSGYPGEPTIPRTGLTPAGLRDPGGLAVNCNFSAHGKPPFVPHCLTLRKRRGPAFYHHYCTEPSRSRYDLVVSLASHLQVVPKDGGRRRLSRPPAAEDGCASIWPSQPFFRTPGRFNIVFSARTESGRPRTLFFPFGKCLGRFKHCLTGF
jgi:hypothetical protein